MASTRRVLWGLGGVAAVMMLTAAGCGDDDCKRTLTCPTGSGGDGGAGAGMSTSTGDGGSTTSGMGGDGMGAPNGTACMDEVACESGNCVDGVCCDTACEGTCEGCAVSGTEGTCTPHPADEDPDSECGVASCDGAGSCQVATALWGLVLGDGVNQSVAAVETDTSNNIYVAGSFSGSLTIENTTLTSAGSSDIFVAKFAATGTLIWAVRYGDSDLQSVSFMSVGPRVFIGGSYRGVTTFTNTSLSFSQRTSWYIAALGTSDGLGTWATGQPDNSPVNNINGNSIQGLVHAGSRLYAATRFGSVIGGFSYTLRRYPSNGGTEEDTASLGAGVTAMGRTAAGGLLIGGSFSTNFNVLGGPGVTTSGGADAWVARVSQSLTADWATSFGGSANESVLGIEELPNGELLTIGSSYGDFTVGADTIVNQGDRDGFLVRLSSAGGLMGGVGFGGTGDDLFEDAAVGTDHVVVTGTSDGPLNIGGPLTEGGGEDAILFKVAAADFSVIWGRRAGGLLNQLPRGVAIDALDRIAVGGILEMDMTLGGLLLESTGNQDGFLVQLTP